MTYLIPPPLARHRSTLPLLRQRVEGDGAAATAALDADDGPGSFDCWPLRWRGGRTCAASTRLRGVNPICPIRPRYLLAAGPVGVALK